MKKTLVHLWFCGVCVLLASCSDKTATDTTNASIDHWAAIPPLTLPQHWTQVPTQGSPADSTLVMHFQLPPDTISDASEWKIVGKLSTEKWRGLVYTYTDVETSELHLATYTLADSLISDVILINSPVIGILTSGTFSASITRTFAIRTSERLQSAASESDSTIISDEQTKQAFQITANGVIQTSSRTSTNQIAQAATHPEEEEEDAYYREYRYASPGQAENFIFTIMGREREKHYYFENAEAEQRKLELLGVAQSNPDVYNFRLDGEKITARWQEYTKDGGLSIPQTIVFTFANGTKQTYTLTK